MSDAPYFTTSELRAQYPELQNAAKYPDAVLEAARIYAEQWFEAAAKVAYVPREVTETLDGGGRRLLFLSHCVEVKALSAVTIDGTPLGPEELAGLITRKWGTVERRTGWPAGSQIEVTYTHGYAEPVELARQAVMMLAGEKAKPSTLPARATSLNTDVGSYRISQADKTGKTGIPEVDAIIGLLGEDKPVVG